MKSASSILETKTGGRSTIPYRNAAEDDDERDDTDEDEEKTEDEDEDEDKNEEEDEDEEMSGKSRYGGLLAKSIAPI